MKQWAREEGLEARGLCLGSAKRPQPILGIPSLTGRVLGESIGCVTDLLVFPLVSHRIHPLRLSGLWTDAMAPGRDPEERPTERGSAGAGQAGLSV